MENIIQASGFVIQPRLQFKNIKDKMIYQLLLEEANYAASSRCEIGQTIITLTNLAKEIGWSRDIVKGSLDRLEAANYIETKTLPQKRGIQVTIHQYKELQNLSFYQKERKNPQENPHEVPHEESHENPQENESCIPCESKEEDGLGNKNPQENPHEDTQQNPQEIPHTITAFITSVNNNININKTLKEYLASANVKNMNLSSTDDIEIFVDFATQLNALPANVSKKIVFSYFDCIRLTRQTCTISANILVNFIEKLSKYSVDQIHFALWKRVEQHDDKKEQYTLGILRNTDIHEAKRGLMKLKNKTGGRDSIAKLSGSSEEGQKYDYGF
ncbi:hypothetical protein [Metabacillus fastidiosus]|uniref:hypothetical protein n=1 Tax=Metabacillus fastidiosus TaxID=1458 RepID=UPI0008244FAE|nr:hypothetical protein [Metabacillus fastidiosus]MED4461828.1 hypothetical protein [Metabacillus fastidiosus]